MEEIKKNRGKTKFIFRAIIVLSIIAFFVFCILYTKNQYSWTLWGGAISLILIIFTMIIHTFVKWLWDIRDLMTEYKEKDNLLSGGLALVGVFGFIIVLASVLSRISLFADLKEMFETISALFAAAMPAFIGLLGVQYSVAIQERNRKQDLRLGAKPFFKIRCCKIITILDDNKDTSRAIKIKGKLTNISQNIGIPVKILSCDSGNCEIELPYTPMVNEDVLETEVEVKAINSMVIKYVSLLFIKIYMKICMNPKLSFYSIKSVNYLIHTSYMITCYHVIMKIR